MQESTECTGKNRRHSEKCSEIIKYSIIWAEIEDILKSK